MSKYICTDMILTINNLLHKLQQGAREHSPTKPNIQSWFNPQYFWHGTPLTHTEIPVVIKQSRTSL